MAVVAIVWAKTKNMTLLGKYGVVTNPLPSPAHWLTTLCGEVQRQTESV